jgi:hypothetical protein
MNVERRIDLSNIDLDAAATAIAGRGPAWAAAGLMPDPLTWTDNDDAWPVVLLTDRAKVARPRSLGLRVNGASGSEAIFVVYAGGWADLIIGAPDQAEITQEYVELESANEIGALLDRLTAQMTAERNPPPFLAVSTRDSSGRPDHNRRDRSSRDHDDCPS